MHRIFLILLTAAVLEPAFAQVYLSNLNAGSNDPVYTTYAAPPGKTEYKLDQAYSLSWCDPIKPLGIESTDDGSIGCAFGMKEIVRSHLGGYYKDPIITASYSDLVKLYFYPFRGIKVKFTAAVYSSRFVICDFEIVNETDEEIKIEFYPFFYNSHVSIASPVYYSGKLAFIFNHTKTRDAWMKEHNIPFVENLSSVFAINEMPDSLGGSPDLNSEIFSKRLVKIIPSKLAGSLIFQKNLLLKAGQSRFVRVIRGIQEAAAEAGDFLNQLDRLFKINTDELLAENEKIYSSIPLLKFSNKDYEALYWNSFSLMRQCMMNAEGECGYNYYVFSREPKWGWGYGGQVFHESLTMLAYAFIDPQGAMNSQRVYFERQRKDGYINYRTGPYLNEEIIHNGEYTSSAPWFNYQNYEIFRITGDKKFLRESYESGRKFYNWFTSRRDSNNNGLASWGGHAELESVRDARVAVWDLIGWASNFEGPDINAMLVMEEKSLSAMAAELELNSESEEWKLKSIRRAALINRYLWDEETGFYYNVSKSDLSFSFKQKDDLKIKEIIGFLPLWAGVPDNERADRLLKSLMNEKEFWRKFGVPTLSANHSYYNPIGYWNGPVWVQWQYLIFRGLLNYGYQKEAADLAYKVLDAIVNQLKSDHSFWEFYSADDKQAGWNKAYIWTGLAARFILDLQLIDPARL